MATIQIASPGERLKDKKGLKPEVRRSWISEGRKACVPYQQTPLNISLVAGRIGVASITQTNIHQHNMTHLKGKPQTPLTPHKKQAACRVGFD